MSIRLGSKPPPLATNRVREAEPPPPPPPPPPSAEPPAAPAAERAGRASNAAVAAARRAAAGQDARVRQNLEQQLPRPAEATATASTGTASTSSPPAVGQTGTPAVNPAAAADPASAAAASATRASDLRAEYERNPDNPAQHLGTYMRGAEHRVIMSWPARAGGDRGTVPNPPDSTRCNIFAYNVAYESGLSVPTREVSTRRGTIHGVLSPAELAAPFRSERARDPHGVRDHFDRVEDPSQARPGDWVLYRDRETGTWRHVDVVEANRGADADGRTVLRTVGAGGDEGHEIHGADSHVNPDGTLEYREGRRRRTNFDEVMILRPTHTRPVDPATGERSTTPNALPPAD